MICGGPANLLLASTLIAHTCFAAAPPGPPQLQRSIQMQDEATERMVRQAERAWLQAEWRDYKTRFVAPDGRVIDNGNGGISHSEGQGYAMLLATFAKDEQAFATILKWTDDHLFVRPDGLAAWKWDEAKKAVADKNNATDGDLLMAWALARAATAFDKSSYRDRAIRLAEAIGRTVVVTTPYGPTLLPGAFGFRASDQPDGPIVNLSYFVFPAFDALAPLTPEIPWDEIKATGLHLIEQSRFGPLRLPSDWVSLAASTPAPAKNFPATFGYDAIRVPLYLAAIGSAEAKAGRFATLWNEDRRLGPFVIEVSTGAAERPIEGAGFRMIAALSRCMAKGTPIPQKLMAERDTFYYPASLRLLCVALIEERISACL